MAKQSFFAQNKLRVIVFVTLLALGAWAGVERFVSPLSVNQLTLAQQQKISPQMDCSKGFCQPAPSGCYYKQVQCVRAPCDPILVCASPTPTSSPTTCSEGITSLKISSRCGVTGFSSYEFLCESGKTAQITSETCLEAETIYTAVRTTCSKVCIGDK